MAAFALALGLSILPSGGQANDFTGTVDLSGALTFSAPIPGIDFADITVSVGSETEATGSGEKCSLLATSSDLAAPAGIYPNLGTVDAEILLERGGNKDPEGSCLLTVRASGNDGATTSARGFQTLLVPAAVINSSGALGVDTIELRPSKLQAGLDKECGKWIKKQMKALAKCNDSLLKKGPEAAVKCKDAGPEPLDCDPGNTVEAIVALAYGGNDQQGDAENAEGVDSTLKDQLKCQKTLGKTATGFAAKLIKSVDKKCVQSLLDAEACRATQSNDNKKKLDKIATCVGVQATDPGNGRIVAQVAAPCDACMVSEPIDTKCLRSCFQSVIAELANSVVGEVPQCGNGVVQGAEFCDDGNLVPGDCCSDSCTVEAGTAEGPTGDGTCSDVQDNDCDGLVDLADPDCQ